MFENICWYILPDDGLISRNIYRITIILNEWTHYTQWNVNEILMVVLRRKQNEELMQKNWTLSILRYKPNTFLDGLSNTKKIIGQDIQSLD
jgi:hypothetical protein